MIRRTLTFAVLVLVISSVAMAGIFHHKKKQTNPLANLNSKQPDKVLFDRGMDAMNHSKFDVARLSFQTLINTYPDSEFIARAKLGIGDAWYREGGSTALAQAEIEYKDFITFFPNMPEAAEAQLKVADIHYHEMGKADRDFTNALRAQEEYRQLILQFPDSKLVPVAEQRLREVQEVLAQREFDIGRFYFMQEAWPAAVARLQTVADNYPLYSKADEALYMLGNAYERQIEIARHSKANETAKARFIADYKKKAAGAYARILTRYPVMSRAEDARHRLKALGMPVPAPTPEAIAQNKAEEAGRKDPGRITRLMDNFHHGPDVSEAAHTGNPSLTDPQEASAVQVERDAQAAMAAAPAGNTVGIQTVTPHTGTSDTTPTPTLPQSAPADQNSQSGESSIPELAPLNSSGTQPAAGSQPATTDPQPSSSSASQPASQATDGSGATTAPVPPPPQVNDVSNASGSTATAQPAQSNSQSQESTSKKKKKKGLHKLIPF